MQVEVAQLRWLLLRLIGLIDQREAALQCLEEQIGRTEQLFESAQRPAEELQGARNELCALLRSEAALRGEIQGLLFGAGRKLETLHQALPLRS